MNKTTIVAGAALLLSGALALNYQLYRESQRHRLAAAEARAKADGLVDFMLFQLRDQLEPIGRTDLLEQPARKALEYLDSVRQADDAVEARHRRGVAWDNIGDILAKRGDLPASENAYRQALEIAERLAREQPENTNWQRGLAVGLSRMGDLQQERGYLPQALFYHRQSLEILDRLAQQQPDDRARQYDLGLAHERLGAALQAQGELDGALKQFQARQIIALSLNTLDPENTQWRRDLAVSYGTIGDVYEASGDSDGALAAYRKFEELAQQLAAQNPDHTEWLRDVAISQEKLGDLHAVRGELASANTAYQRLAEISMRLAAWDPSNAQIQRDLAASRSRLAAVMEKQGKPGTAADLQRQAAEALTLIAGKLGTATARGEAGSAWGKLAWYDVLRREPGKAVDDARKGLTLAPKELGITLNLAHALLLTGRVSDAEKIYRENRRAVLAHERGWNQAVNDDFGTLIAKGIVHPEMRRIEEGLKSGK